MKKIYSLLILPVIAIMCFAGCNNKTQRTALECKQLIESTVVKYNYVNENDETLNWYFTDIDASEESKNYKFYVTYDNTCKLNAIANEYYENSMGEMSEDLKVRYKQLTTVYAPTLTMAYNYYLNWNQRFYEFAGEKEIDSKEMTELFDRIKAFSRELEDFHIAKINLEREVELFGLNSEILSASVDTFNYSYNKLISSTLNFVNYFKDLHVKYYFSGENIEVDASYAKRLYDESLLQIANYAYYDILNSHNKNSVVNLTQISNNSTRNIFAGAVEDFASKDKVAGLKEDFTSVTFTEEAKQVVNQFETTLTSYKKFFDIYKKVYDKFDWEKWNLFVFEGLGNYDEASAEELANKNIIDNFESNKVYNLINAMSLLCE